MEKPLTSFHEEMVAVVELSLADVDRKEIGMANQILDLQK